MKQAKVLEDRKKQGQNKKQMGVQLTEKNMVLIWEGSLDKFLIEHTCTFNRIQS